MEGNNVIVVPEKRETIEKMKEKNKLQKAYQEKVVDTGVSDKIDKFIDKKAEILTGGAALLGGTCTVLLTVCPVDGPVGEICSGILTCGACGLITVLAPIEKKIAHSVKGFAEKKIMNVDKENDNVVMYNDSGEVMNDFVVAMNAVNKVQNTPQGVSRGVAA